MSERTEFIPQYGEELTDHELLRWEGRCFKESEQHFAKWREECKVMSELYAGETYSPKDLAWLRDTNRPKVELNYARNVIESVVGADLEDRQEARFEAAATDSPRKRFVAELRTNVVRILMERCRGYQHQNLSLLHLLIYGYGWNETYSDPEKLPVLPVLRSVHPQEMYPDPNATDRNLEDKRWLIRERIIPLEEAQSRWPEHAEDLSEYSGSGSASGGMFAAMRKTGSSVADLGSPSNSGVRLREFQYCRLEPLVRYYDSELAAYRTVSPDDFEALGTDPEDAIRYAGRRYYRAFIIRGMKSGSPGLVLERKPLDTIECFTYRCATGSPRYTDDGQRMVCFGIARTLYDAQRLMNRTTSNTLEYLARATKGGTDFEEGAIPAGMNVDDVVKASSTIGAARVWSDGALAEGRVKERSVAPWPSSFERFFDFLQRAVGDITVPPAFRAAEGEGYQSQALLTNQQRQALVVLASMFENMRNFREDGGQLLARMARKEVPTAVLDEMLEGSESEGVTFAMEQDPMSGQMQRVEIATPGEVLHEDDTDLSVTVDTGVASPSTRRAIVSIFLQHGIFKEMKEAGVPPSVVLIPLLKFSELPESISQEMIQGIEASMAEQQQAQTLEGAMEQLSQMPPEEITSFVETVIQQFNLVPFGAQEAVQ